MQGEPQCDPVHYYPRLPLTEESKEPEDIKVAKAINSIIPGFFLVSIFRPMAALEESQSAY